MPIPTGARLGSFEIVAPLGAGGMGEVYRARDARLGRDVAIKILPSELGADPERLARFEREARALAALNHPNIATLYGVEDTSAGIALVMELVDGETLHARVSSRPLPIDEALAIARQIADALDAAHERGIVHRDLKPANIAITSDGTVKVLDFGLAKTAEAHGHAADDLSHSPTTVAPTLAGVLLGTAPYMAPEQARGKVVDKRADIWAFGCVLYEMLAGRRGFGGETATDAIAAIVERDPDWAALPPATPPSVRWLLRRCLEKDPRRRLRDIGDARLDLDGAAAEPSPAPDAAGTSRRRVLAAFAAGVLVAGAATGVGLVAYRRLARGDAGPSFTRVVRLTSTPAFESAPALSPDGKWVAYLSTARGPTDVWVKFLAGGEPVNLTASASLDIQSQTDIGGVAVSPDGASLAFDAGEPGTGPTSVTSWVMPAPLGGSPRKFLAGARGLRWSPDGARVVYISAGGSAGDSLFVAEADGGNPREVAPRLGGMHKHWATWSSDSRYVYFNYSISTANAEPTEIFRVPAGGGAIEPVVRTSRRAEFPVLLAQGRGLIYTANPDTFELGLFWRPLGEGTPRRLSAGIGEYAQPTVANDGRRLVSMFVEFQQALVAVAAAGDAGTPRPVTDGSTGDLDPAFAPDGSRVVFTSTRAGNRHLWISAADGRDARLLTSGRWIDERPVFSPDASRIAFVSDRGGSRGLWIVNADGGAARLVVKAEVLDSISWAPDGRRIVYALPAEKTELWVVSIDDGAARRIATPGSASTPAWSPHGDVIAYVDTIPTSGRPGLVTTHVAFTTSDGRIAGTPIPLVAIGNGGLLWDSTGQRLAVYGNSGGAPSAVWIVDAAGREPTRRLAVFPVDVRLRGISWSRDGSTLLLGQQRRTSDLVLFEAE